jgi:hypothetical protein
MPRDRSELVVIWWRDLPAQVNAQSDGERFQVMLPDRFQRAIDRARRKGKIDTADEEVQQWRRESEPLDGDPEGAALAEAARLDSEYSRERLGRIAFVGGWEPDATDFDISAEELAALEELPEGSDD